MLGLLTLTAVSVSASSLSASSSKGIHPSVKKKECSCEKKAHHAQKVAQSTRQTHAAKHVIHPSLAAKDGGFLTKRAANDCETKGDCAKKMQTLVKVERVANGAAEVEKEAEEAKEEAQELIQQVAEVKSAAYETREKKAEVEEAKEKEETVKEEVEQDVKEIASATAAVTKMKEEAPKAKSAEAKVHAQEEMEVKQKKLEEEQTEEKKVAVEEEYVEEEATVTLMEQEVARSEEKVESDKFKKKMKVVKMLEDKISTEEVLKVKAQDQELEKEISQMPTPAPGKPQTASDEIKTTQIAKLASAEVLLQEADEEAEEAEAQEKKAETAMHKFMEQEKAYEEAAVSDDIGTEFGTLEKLEDSLGCDCD